MQTKLRVAFRRVSLTGLLVLPLWLHAFPCDQLLVLQRDAFFGTSPPTAAIPAGGVLVLSGSHVQGASAAAGGSGWEHDLLSASPPPHKGAGSWPSPPATHDEQWMRIGLAQIFDAEFVARALHQIARVEHLLSTAAAVLTLATRIVGLPLVIVRLLLDILE